MCIVSPMKHQIMGLALALVVAAGCAYTPNIRTETDAFTGSTYRVLGLAPSRALDHAWMGNAPEFHTVIATNTGPIVFSVTAYGPDGCHDRTVAFNADGRIFEVSESAGSVPDFDSIGSTMATERTFTMSRDDLLEVARAADSRATICGRPVEFPERTKALLIELVTGTAPADAPTSSVPGRLE